MDVLLDPWDMSRCGDAKVILGTAVLIITFGWLAGVLFSFRCKVVVRIGGK
jgi:hypothetical protein